MQYDVLFALCGIFCYICSGAMIEAAGCLKMGEVTQKGVERVESQSAGPQCSGCALKRSEILTINIEGYMLPQSSTLTPDRLFFDHSLHTTSYRGVIEK